jgi:serine/threonine protein phosphatase PrpC
MTLALRYSIRSDVGLLREGNEDSAYAGPHLLAIADGMGGHAAGEVASAVAISALAPLDQEMAAGEMLAALAEAVAEANGTLHEMSIADPSVEGMGTTLTALLWSGPKVAVCHIGDSRAYLLRDGKLAQITRDHTLVQSLVDEGRLTPEAAAVHPQRSLVMRALQSSTDAEPDLSMREGRLGDRYLLCSDGLSDVVSEDTLQRTLTQLTDLDEAVLQLIDLAIRSGGPDNITCVLADVVDTVAGPLAPSEAPVVVGAASSSDGRQRLRNDSPAERAHVLTQSAAAASGEAASGGMARANTAQATMTHGRPDLAVEADGYDPRLDGAPADYDEDDDDDLGDTTVRRRWPVVTTILAVLVIVVVGGSYAAWRYTRSQYYVGTDAGQVVIYRGVNQTVAGLKLSNVYQHTGIPVSGVPSTDTSQINGTIPASGLVGAQHIVSQIKQDYTKCHTALTALQQWKQDKPKPAKVKIKDKGKTKVVTRTPSYPPAPQVPAGCPSPGAAG